MNGVDKSTGRLFTQRLRKGISSRQGVLYHVLYGVVRTDDRVTAIGGRRCLVAGIEVLADANLVDRARRFISLHKLTGMDAESLALLATQRPALLAQLLELGEGT